jgi:hypothetical protein
MTERMATESAAQRLKEIDEQRASLERERGEIEEEIRAEALGAATRAIATLVSLGYDYRLSGTGKRRGNRGLGWTGIREQVLGIVRTAGPKGIDAAGVRRALDVDQSDTSGSQAIANALFALKRASKITNRQRKYTALKG